MLVKGHRKLKDLGKPDVFQCKSVHGKEKLWPTQKPLSLVEELVLNSTEPGEIIYDPFCGAGTVPLAAHKHGRRWLAYDIEERAIEITNSRMWDNISGLFGNKTDKVNQVQGLLK